MESIPFRSGGAAVAPVAPWIGGKRNLAKRVIDRISAINHDLYAEPFLGMGGIFLRRPNRAKVEVINDLSTDVVNLFRILQRHYVPFVEMLRWQLTTRADFERLCATNPDTLTDLERAARFIYLQRTGFGGKVMGRTFGMSRTVPARFDTAKLIPMLEDVHERLSGVVVERLPFGDFIARYDRPGALFYMDPPYYGSEGFYGRDMFSRADFEALAEQLAQLKGRFILSLNDHPEVRRIFGQFAIEAVTTTYTMAGGNKAKAVGEVLISRP